MTRSNNFLIAAAVLLGGIYCYFFTDWFKVRIIQIIPQNRPMLGATRPTGSVCPVTFMLEQPYQLTSVSVYSVSSLQTNKNSTAVWKLTAKPNSKPIRGFAYGSSIPGMAPGRVPAAPEELVANVPYRIVLEAAKAKGQADFVPVATAVEQ